MSEHFDLDGTPRILSTAHDWYGTSLQWGRCARCGTRDYYGARCVPHWESARSGYLNEEHVADPESV